MSGSREASIQVVVGETFAADGSAVGDAPGDDDDGSARDDRVEATGSRVEPGEDDREAGHRADGEDRSGDRGVLACDALLDEVAHGDEDDELERAELAESRAADDACDGPEDEEDDGGANDGLHGGLPGL